MPHTRSGKQKNPAQTRITQACNRCRQRKSRCDGGKPCSVCEKHATECTYETFRRRRGQGRSKEYIRELEARLRGTNPSEPISSYSWQTKSTSHQLSETTTAAKGTEQPKAIAKDTDVRTPIRASGRELASSDILGQAARSTQTTSNCTPNSSSTPSTILPDGTTTFSTYVKSGISKDIPSPKIVLSPVPTSDVIKLLEPMFDNTNTGYPFLSLPLFFIQLSFIDSAKDLAWRALLDSVIALAMLTRPALNCASSIVEAKDKFEKSYALLPQIITLDPEVLAIEAMLAMAIFTKLSADARTAAQLVSSAVKMYQMAALRKDPSQMLTISTSYKRYRRAFWTAYILDREISSQCGLPPAIDDDDFILVPEGPNMHTHMQGLSPALQIRSEIAIIDSLIYKRLYRRKVFEQPESERLVNIAELDWTLESWSWPASADFRPSLDNPNVGANPKMGTLMVHFAYYNCVNMVHWAVRRRGLRKDISNSILPDRFKHSQSLSTEKSRKAARATLGLLQELPQYPFVDLWRILCYPISATIILLAGILENPLSTNSKSDIWVLQSFRQFIEENIQNNGYELQRVLKGCLQMEKLAFDVVNKTEATPLAEGMGGVEEEAPPGTWNDALNKRAQTTKDILLSCAHPMYVAQGLVTNIHTRDGSSVVALSKALGIYEEGDRQYGFFIPDILWPQAK